MRKIFLFTMAGALAACLASSSALGADGEKSKQVVVEALLLCRSQVLFQDGKVAGVHFQACAVLQPNADPVHTT